MRKQSAAIASSAIMLLLCLNSSTFSQTVTPQYQTSVHNQGNIQMTITNRGIFGSDPGFGSRPNIPDPFTGELLAGLVYPRGSHIQFFEGALAIGAIVGGDTLVTSSAEFAPDAFPFSNMIMKSFDRSSPFFSPDARSELDITTIYFDTLTDPRFIPIDPFDNRPHKPIGLQIKQRSMSWSGLNIDDFILIEYEVGNMGSDTLHELYIRFAAQDKMLKQIVDTSAQSVTGFLREWIIDDECGVPDDVDVAYFMDDDGYMSDLRGSWRPEDPRAAVGIRILGLHKDSVRLNYNWFSNGRRFRPHPDVSCGPRRKPIFPDRLRKLGASLALPEGDANNYYVMTNPEFDYDEWFKHTDMTALGWLPRCDEYPCAPQVTCVFGFPGAAESEQSFGPFTIRPRGSIRFTIAVVGGDSVHVDPAARLDQFEHHDRFAVQAFIDQLDFSRLAENARWASWVYDNPGVDTDGDGFFGKFRMCNGDTFWYEGDGVPDFKADIPPPSPEVRVIPAEGKLTLRWNGVYSENVIDPFTRAKDFEGYRVYSGLDDRASSLSLLSSFDHLNFNMFKFIQKTNDLFVWENDDLPFSLDSLKVIFNDQNFDPLKWTRNNPLTLNDTLFRFEKQDFNQFDLTTRGGIRKVFPDAIDPGPDTLLWNDSDLVFDWDPPLPKFYEYEFEVENLLPTIRQFVSVTAFDFGFPPGNIPPRESNKLNSITESFPQNNVDSVEQYNLDVYIYPNPYRIDGNYIERGFENRDGTQANQRAHRVHFVNLPRICKITIYSLDGDRIDSFEHNFPQGGPEAMHDEWDMITRNGLIPVSGIYYWVVEAATRTQMGKLIIIK